MLKNFYETLEDAKQRLEGTVVTYDGTPAWVHSVANHRDGTFRLHITILPGSIRAMMDGVARADFVEDEEDVAEPIPRSVRKKINSPKFNKFRPFNLGYLNYFVDSPYAKFAARTPVRRTKQGLFHEGFICNVHRGSRGIGLHEVVEDASFSEMVRGEYPSFEEAMDTIDLSSSMAVSREFAIGRDGLGLDFLFYKQDKVGLVRGDTVDLGRDFTFLREAILAEPKLPNNVRNL